MILSSAKDYENKQWKCDAISTSAITGSWI